MTRDVAQKLHWLKPASIYSVFFPALKGLNEKMSSSDPTTCIILTDSAQEVETKIKRYAKSGGGATLEDQLRDGANLDIDIPYQYLTFFLEDDRELAAIKERYAAGQMLTGEVKDILVKTLQGFLRDFQDRRSKVTDDDVAKFMAVRSIDPRPNS